MSILWGVKNDGSQGFPLTKLMAVNTGRARLRCLWLTLLLMLAAVSVNLCVCVCVCVCVWQSQGCNSTAVTQLIMAILQDYSALSLGTSADILTRLVSVSSHFTCNLLTAVTCTYTLSGIICDLLILLIRETIVVCLLCLGYQACQWSHSKCQH